MRMRAASPKSKPILAAIGAFVGLLAAAAAISGCGVSATLDPVARAALLSSEQAGARVALKVQLTSSLLPGAFTITADGYVDEPHRAAQMSMNLSGIPGASALAGEGGKIEVILRYPTVYMNMPFLAGKLPEGKTWIKLDLSKAAKAAGIDLSQLSSLNQTDPTQYLAYLRASSGHVTAVGSESLFGVPTTRYHTTLQLSHMLDQLPDAQRASAKALLEKFGSAGAVPVDAWVDKQGRLRQMQMSVAASLPAGSPAASGAVNGTVTVDFLSYGPVPPIVAPPASQTFDATALAGAGLSGARPGG
jgi:hypothetical protein